MNIESWGRNPKTRQQAQYHEWRHLPLTINSTPLLPYGLGRSYGDACLNDGGTVILTNRLNRFITFNRENGRLTCEAGVSLAEVLTLVVPNGWFLPVVPGTKHVTIGGAIANDVHGKNHHRAGTFGRHILRLELLRSNGDRLTCSPAQNPAFYKATIGGLGLTGLILSAEIQLLPIANPFVAVEQIKIKNLAEFFQLSRESDVSHTYTVAWIDSSARGKKLGRGIFIRGNHANSDVKKSWRPKRELTLPLDMPSFLLNRASLTVMNRGYYLKQPKIVRSVEHYEPFFFPLDGIGHWNRVYGRRGFYQYQCVVSDEETVRQLFEKGLELGVISFITVLKQFGGIPSPGLCSFPQPGYTLALDYPATKRALELMPQMDQLVREAGGRVYPAKDARMSGSDFKHFYPMWEHFAESIDPAFSSSFWRRVMGEEGDQ